MSPNRPRNDTVCDVTMPRVTSAQRSDVTRRLQAGTAQQVVARHFDVAKQTIPALLEGYNTIQSVNDRSRLGRRKVTTPTEDRYIRVCHLRNRTTKVTITVTLIPGQCTISD